MDHVPVGVQDVGRHRLVGLQKLQERFLGRSKWLSLILSAHSHHRRAIDWFDTIVDAGSIFFCRATQQGTSRLLTISAVLAPYGRGPLSHADALQVYDQLLADDRIEFLGAEPDKLEPVWRRLAHRETASPKLWRDASLAAFAITGRYRLVTLDTAFRQFPSLDLHLL